MTNKTILSDWLFAACARSRQGLPIAADNSFMQVSLPHTWNATDAQKGAEGFGGINITDYLRAEFLYRRQVTINTKSAYYLQFDGAGQAAEVYLNGKFCISHKGGYQSFTADCNDFFKSGDNSIDVAVTNVYDETICPLTADFPFFGGLYRPVTLIEKNRVHFAPQNGVFSNILASQVQNNEATVSFSAWIKNLNAVKKSVIVRVELFTKPVAEQLTLTGIEPLDCDPATMFSKKTKVCESTTEMILDAGGLQEFSALLNISNPKLWDGRLGPNLYSAEISLWDGDSELDREVKDIGFRSFFVDKQRGFFLNGHPYPLRGVARHQDRDGLGNAVSNACHDEDFALIYDLGATAVRLAHYQQAQRMYELCDAYGVVVWAEIPFVDLVGGRGTYNDPDVVRQGFFDNTEVQLTELIRQCQSHASIAFWGLQNEVKAEFSDVMIPYMQHLHGIAKALDPTRLTTQATNHGGNKEWASDLSARNVYPGWYGGRAKDLGIFCDLLRGKQPVGLSEYGAGGSIGQHEFKPKAPKTTGPWHPEEYQTACHEQYLVAINKRPYLWATFVWNMFDFASNWRAEGGRRGLNDKGLVSYDRQTKKDVYYLYQTAWRTKKPVIYLRETRFYTREQRVVDVAVYSNCESVLLKLNGVAQKTLYKHRNKLPNVFLFKRIKLCQGDNLLCAEGLSFGEIISACALWTYKPNA